MTSAPVGGGRSSRKRRLRRRRDAGLRPPRLFVLPTAAVDFDAVRAAASADVPAAVAVVSRSSSSSSSASLRRVGGIDLRRSVASSCKHSLQRRQLWRRKRHCRWHSPHRLPAFEHLRRPLLRLHTRPPSSFLRAPCFDVRGRVPGSRSSFYSVAAAAAAAAAADAEDDAAPSAISRLLLEPAETSWNEKQRDVVPAPIGFERQQQQPRADGRAVSAPLAVWRRR